MNQISSWASVGAMFSIVAGNIAVGMWRQSVHDLRTMEEGAGIRNPQRRLKWVLWLYGLASAFTVLACLL